MVSHLTLVNYRFLLRELFLIYLYARRKRTEGLIAGI